VRAIRVSGSYRLHGTEDVERVGGTGFLLTTITRGGIAGVRSMQEKLTATPAAVLGLRTSWLWNGEIGEMVLLGRVDFRRQFHLDFIGVVHLWWALGRYCL